MLKLHFRRSQRYKCPEHPKQQYRSFQDAPHCMACRAILEVQRARVRLDLAERNASRWIVAAIIRKEGGV